MKIFNLFAFICILALGSCGTNKKQVANTTLKNSQTSELYPGCTKIFNGENFDGWIADTTTWSIVDGAMQRVGGASSVSLL